MILRGRIKWQSTSEDGNSCPRSAVRRSRGARRTRAAAGDAGTELVRRSVSLIFAAGGNVAARAAKRATVTIPIVFAIGADPVEQGIVASPPAEFRNGIESLEESAILLIVNQQLFGK